MASVDNHSQPRLAAGIVGAGIAGLAAAIALRRAGWDVEVFEKSQFRNEVGAAVSLTPNATRVLHAWGFDFEKAGAVVCEQIRYIDAKTMSNLSVNVYGDLEPEYGAKAHSLHRVDLHSGLPDLATGENNLAGNPVRIVLGAAVRNVNCHQGIVGLEAGGEVKKDLIVVADGGHSKLLESVHGQTEGLTRLPRATYRCLVPMERIMADVETCKLFENETPGYIGCVAQPGTRMAFMYPCRRQEILNCSLLHDTAPEKADAHDWNSPATIEDVQNTFHDFHPTLKRLFAMTDEVKVYTLGVRPPLGSYNNGKVVVLGDAAHVMLPSHTQGAGITFEDAAALEVLFLGVCEPEAVPQRLQTFDRVRGPRDKLVQLLSNNPMSHSKAEQEIRRYFDGPLPPDAELPLSKHWRDLFFHYDAFHEAEEALKSSIVR